MSVHSMEQVPVGTAIRFLRTLEEPANEEHPRQRYCTAGQAGMITGHGTKEGYWAVTDCWPNAFGIAREEFEVIAPDPAGIAPAPPVLAQTGVKSREDCRANGGACIAAKFDGIPCAAGTCDIRDGNRKEPLVAGPRRVLKRRPNRRRRAHWQARLGADLYRFTYDPGTGLILIRKDRARKGRTITMAELLHALEGQNLLPL